MYPKRPADAAAPAGPAAAGKVACKGQASPYRRRSHRGCLPLPLPAQGNHPDDTPVHACSAANVAKYTGISALSGSARAQGTAAQQQQGLCLLPVSNPCCPGSLPPLACSAVDAPFNNTLVALQASFRCSNRGPPVKMISNKLQNMVLLSAEVANASDSAGLTCTWFRPPRRRTMRAHAYKLVRLPKEERGKRLLYKKLYSSGLGRAHRALRDMLMLG